MRLRKTYWNKFQKLHAKLVAAVQVVETIYMHPDSLQKLSDEMRPRMRSGADPGLITGAVTHCGPVKIQPDPMGVVL